MWAVLAVAAADFKINWRGVACARHTAGMAEDWIDLDGFARLLGHADQRTLSSWRARGVPAGHPVPEPDDVVVERGHARPRWRRATVEAWMAARPGRGRRRADR